MAASSSEQESSRFPVRRRSRGRGGQALGLRSQGKRHPTLEDRLSVGRRHAMQLPHPAAQPFHVDLDTYRVTGMRRVSVSYTFDTDDIDEFLPVLWFRKNQDGPNLGDSLGQNGGWDDGLLAGSL